MKRWWALFYLGAGGALMFGYVKLIAPGWPPPGMELIYIWPIISALLCGLAVLRLRRLYCAQDEKVKGGLHLSLAELLVSSFIVSVLFAIFHTTQNNEDFMRLCVPGSLFGGALFVAGLLIANRMRIDTAWAKYGYACGFPLKTAGALVIGAAVSTAMMISIRDLNIGIGFQFCREVLLGSTTEEIIFRPLRVGIAVFPIGYLICWLTSRTRARPVSQPPQA